MKPSSGKAGHNANERKSIRLSGRTEALIIECFKLVCSNIYGASTSFAGYQEFTDKVAGQKFCAARNHVASFNPLDDGVGTVLAMKNGTIHHVTESYESIKKLYGVIDVKPASDTAEGACEAPGTAQP